VVFAAAGAFAVVGASVTSSGASDITGDIGSTPGDIVGLPPGTLRGTQHAADAAATAGMADLAAAFDDAAGRTLCPIAVTALAGNPNLGGRTLSPGLYKSETAIDVVAFDVTLDAGGDDDAVFIFQVATTLNTSANRRVILSNGAQAKNVFWQVGETVTLASGTDFQGSVMANDDVTLGAGASIDGRALSKSGVVTLDAATITTP
jgi:hypothetical protein